MKKRALAMVLAAVLVQVSFYPAFGADFLSGEPLPDESVPAAEEDVLLSDGFTDVPEETEEEGNLFSDSEQEYSYTVTPLLEPFNELFYVQTEDPNPSGLRFVDKDSVLLEGNDKEDNYMAPASRRYLDVAYENEETGRVKGGYIFKAYSTDIDGGTLVVEKNVGRGTWEETGVTVECVPVTDYIHYLINTCTSPEKDFFANMDDVESAAGTIAVYPRSIKDKNRKNDRLPFPLLAVSPYPELSLNPWYQMYEDSPDGMLLNDLYPFIMDSLGFPSAMLRVAQTLQPSCTYQWGNLHYQVDITWNGKTQTYGGAGAGSNDPLYSDRIEKLFLFDGSAGDFRSGLSLEKLKNQYRSYDSVTQADADFYEDLIRGDTFKKTIGNGSWIRVGTEGLNLGSHSIAFVTKGTNYNIEGSAVVSVEDIWVDGRYVNIYNQYVQGAKFEDYPEASIMVRNMLHKNSWGSECTGDLTFKYNKEKDCWVCNDYNVKGVQPLTREEVEAMDVDQKTDIIPAGLIYDGSAYPGTPYDPADMVTPSPTPTSTPTPTPTSTPIPTPTSTPTPTPTSTPIPTLTSTPTPTPTEKPEATPTEKPEATPTEKPEATPTEKPEATPTEKPEATPTGKPEATPTEKPEATPTEKPEATPTEKPEATPTEKPEATPTEKPEATPTEKPEATPTEKPEATPTETPEATPTEAPIPTDTPSPTPEITAAPQPSPSAAPTSTPTPEPEEKPVLTPGPASSEEGNISAVPSLGTRKVTLTWEPVADAAGYEIYLKDEKTGEFEKIQTLQGSDATSYTGEMEEFYGTYTFKICSFSESGTVEDLGEVSVRLYEFDKSLRPSARAVTKTGSSGITLRWNQIPGADGYLIYRYNPTVKKYELLSQISGGESTSCSLQEGFQYGTSYAFRIRPFALKADGKQQVKGKACTTVKVTTPPERPKKPSVKSGKGQVRISWPKVKKAKGYRIYRSDSRKGKYQAVGTVSGKTGSFTDKNLAPGKVYYYKVRAYTLNQGKESFGPASAAGKVKVKKK